MRSDIRTFLYVIASKDVTPEKHIHLLFQGMVRFYDFSGAFSLLALFASAYVFYYFGLLSLFDFSMTTGSEYVLF